MEDLIRAEHVCKSFGRIKAVDDLSLTLAPGEILGLLGANGAGKTTLIRMICGLLSQDSGDIRVDGRPGYMCQSFSLVEELTVRENIRYYGAIYGLSNSKIAERIKEIESSIILGPHIDKQVRHLSSGGRQAISFTIAVLANPKVLILDEPTSGLDALSRRRIWNMIKDRAAEGTGVIISTHYLDEAFNCSSLAIMSRGKLIAYGHPRDLVSTETDLLKFFEEEERI